MRLAIALLGLAACGKSPCARETTPRGTITTCGDRYRREVSGVLVEEVRYVDGQREGLYVSHYPNGAEHERGLYRLGARTGPWVSFHENGKPWVTASYLDGLAQGPWVETDYSGTKIFEGTYDHGKLEGTWQTWRETGKPRAQGTSHAGKLDGKEIQYSADGGKMELTWRANVVHGPVVIYDATGKVTQTLEYADGAEVKK